MNTKVIDWFKIYEFDYKKNQTKVEDKDWKIFIIDFKEIRKKLKATDYWTRFEFENAMVDLLPKELPHSVREYIVFNR